jgi:hypothetical protein
MARDINGQWRITQSNGFELMFDIVQERDGTLRGSGEIIGGKVANGRGRLDGDQFTFTVDWNNNGKGGRYTGSFDGRGRLSGTTVDLDHPSSGATWFAHGFEPT